MEICFQFWAAAHRKACLKVTNGTLLAHWAWNSWSCLNVKGTGKHVKNLQYEQNCIALQSNGLELGLLCSRCMNGTIPEKLWSMILPQRVAEKIHLKDKLLSIKQYLVLVLTFHAKRWTTLNWLLIEDKKLIWTFGKIWEMSMFNRASEMSLRW